MTSAGTNAARTLVALWAGASAFSCAARGHIATPAEMVRLHQANGLSASGRLMLSGPQGRFSTAVVFGVARPDSLRIEIPAGTGLRFLLVAREGKLRAELPGDDAMYEGPATGEIMNRLFGIDLDPKALVGAILGSPPEPFRVGWRFDRTFPSQISIEGVDGTRLSLTLRDPEIEAPPGQAFDFGAPRAQSWTLDEMSARLGLKR